METINSKTDSSLLPAPVMTKTGVSASHDEINKMLQDLGILNGHAFEAFYFLVTEIFMHREGDRELSNMDDLAKHLNELSELSKQWDLIKKAFYDGATQDTTADLQKDVIDMLNDLIPHSIVQALFGKSGDLFDPGTTIIDIGTFEKIYDYIDEHQNDAGFLETNFPALGSNVLTVLANFRHLSILMFTYSGDSQRYMDRYPKWNWTDGETLPALWATANKINYDPENPAPIGGPNCLQDYIDGLSMNSSQFRSVSSAEEAKVQYASNQYNQLMGFVKEMLSAYQKIKKLSLQNWKAS